MKDKTFWFTRNSLSLTYYFGKSRIEVFISFSNSDKFARRVFVILHNYDDCRFLGDVFANVAGGFPDCLNYPVTVKFGTNSVPLCSLSDLYSSFSQLKK